MQKEILATFLIFHNFCKDRRSRQLSSCFLHANKAQAYFLARAFSGFSGPCPICATLFRKDFFLIIASPQFLWSVSCIINRKNWTWKLVRQKNPTIFKACLWLKVPMAASLYRQLRRSDSLSYYEKGLALPKSNSPIFFPCPCHHLSFLQAFHQFSDRQLAHGISLLSVRSNG